MGKSILGIRDSKGKGPKQGCAQYLKNSKEARVESGVADEGQGGHSCGGPPRSLACILI